jgi:nucleoside-diphosphate-sugar epimerase
MMSVWQTVIQNHDKCNDGKIFTIGPDNPIKIKDYADMIANKIGWNGKINWNTKPARPGEIYWLNSNATLLEKTLGWSSKTSLDAGLDYTIDIWNKKI